MFKRPIKRGFSVIWKTTPRKLTHIQVIGKAFAANPFSGAGFVTAVASIHIFFLITIHMQASL